MLIEQTLSKLHDLRLTGIIEAYRKQSAMPAVVDLSFDERFALLIDHEWTNQQNRRLATRLKTPVFVRTHHWRTLTGPSPAASVTSSYAV